MGTIPSTEICGRAIADGMLVPISYDDGAKQEYGFIGNVRKGGPTDFFWRVTKAELVDWKISKDDLMDCVRQLSEMGNIEQLRDMLGISPGQGLKYCDFGLRSETNPKICCRVVVNSRTAYGHPYWDADGGAPSNFNDYGQVIEIYFYYDIHNVVSGEETDDRLVGDMNKLLFGDGVTVPTLL